MKNFNHSKLKHAWNISLVLKRLQERGEAVVTLFETKTISQRNSTKKKLQHWNLVWQLLQRGTMWNCEKKAVEPLLSPNWFFWQETAVATVSPTFLQFHIEAFSSNWYSKFQCCKSLFSWVPLTFSFNKCHFRPLPLIKSTQSFLSKQIR